MWQINQKQTKCIISRMHSLMKRLTLSADDTTEDYYMGYDEKQWLGRGVCHQFNQEFMTTTMMPMGT